MKPVAAGEHESELVLLRRMLERERLIRTEAERIAEERTRELYKANGDLQMLLYVISHDLKEPVRAVRSFAHLVQERAGKTLNADGSRFLDRVIQAGERMQRLLDDLLVLSRARRLEVPPGGVDLGYVAAEVLQRLEPRVQETGAGVHVAKNLPRVKANPTWAIEAVYNLVTNALKHTVEGHAPEIHLEPYVPQVGEPGAVGLVVADRGPGVDDENRERIFGLFQRAVGREVEGTGAGLAIVRQVAERHGGHAWHRPRAGGGSEFVITFGGAAPDAEDSTGKDSNGEGSG